MWTHPILSILPVEGYQNNPVAAWLVEQPESVLAEIKERLDRLWDDYYNPATCLPSNLDPLAVTWGLKEREWDRNWSIAQKRIILEKIDWIYRNKGSIPLLQFLLDTLSLEGTAIANPNWFNNLGEVVVKTRFSSRYELLNRKQERICENWVDSGNLFFVRTAGGFFLGYSRLGIDILSEPTTGFYLGYSQIEIDVL